MSLEMPFGDGLKDAIWRGDRISSGMGLKMPSGMFVELQCDRSAKMRVIMVSVSGMHLNCI